MSQSITELLSTQHQQVQQLLVLTEKTHHALLERDMITLSQLISEEEQLLISIAETDQKTQEHPDLDLLKSDTCQEQVKEIKSILSTCQRFNQVNQEHIDMSLGALNRLKKILVTNRNQNSLTYTDKGQPHTIASSGESIEA